MTSRRHSPTLARMGSTLATAAFLTMTLAAFSGCASLPEDSPVMEQLDPDTGITIARLGRPVELYRETFLQEPSGRFAFLGPFETNQMGSRELFLWLALPVDPAPGVEPIVEVNGATLALPQPARGAESAGLHVSPYKIPTPWSAMFYYKVDAALVARLGEASSLTIRITESTKDGTAKTLFASKVEDSRLREFANR